MGVEFTTQLEDVPGESNRNEGGGTTDVGGEDYHLPATRRRSTPLDNGWRLAGLVRF